MVPSVSAIAANSSTGSAHDNSSTNMGLLIGEIQAGEKGRIKGGFAYSLQGLSKERFGFYEKQPRFHKY